MALMRHVKIISLRKPAANSARMCQAMRIETLIAVVRVLRRLPGVIHGSVRLISGCTTAASSLMVLATHASSVVVSCFYGTGETSHLVLAVVRRAVTLWAAGIQPSNRGAQTGGARWLANLHPW